MDQSQFKSNNATGTGRVFLQNMQSGPSGTTVASDDTSVVSGLPGFGGQGRTNPLSQYADRAERTARIPGGLTAINEAAPLKVVEEEENDKKNKKKKKKRRDSSSSDSETERERRRRKRREEKEKADAEKRRETQEQVAARLKGTTLKIFGWSTLFFHAVVVGLYIGYFNKQVKWQKEPPGLRPTPNARNEAAIFFAMVEAVLLLAGSVALAGGIRSLAMLTIILLVTCTSIMHVFWADKIIRIFALGVVFVTVVCATTITWFSEAVQHAANEKLTKQIREIERDPRKNRDMVYEIEAAQSRNVVFFALLTTFMAEAAFVVGIAMLVLSLLVAFPIYPGDKVIITHLRTAGVVLTIASLIGAFGAYTKRRTFLIMAMIIATGAALSASNLAASVAMLRNWLAEVQKFCRNDQLDGVTAKACAKQNTLATATSAVNYMCWITSVILAWGCWMLEEFIQDWEEAESKNVDRNLSDEFDIIPGLLTIPDPIRFYRQMIFICGTVSAICGVAIIGISTGQTVPEEQRWTRYAILLGVCLLIVWVFDLYAVFKKGGRLPLTLAFFMSSWMTGFCVHMLYITFAMFTYGAQTGYIVVPPGVRDDREHLTKKPLLIYNGSPRTRLHGCLGVSTIATLMSLFNMYFIMMCSEAIQDRDEERPSLPKRRRSQDGGDEGLIGRLRSTISAVSTMFGRGGGQRSGLTPRGGGGDGVASSGTSFFGRMMQGRQQNQSRGPVGPVGPVPSYLKAALQDENAEGLVLGRSEKSFLARTLGLKGRGGGGNGHRAAPPPAAAPKKKQRRGSDDSQDSFKSFELTAKAKKRGEETDSDEERERRRRKRREKKKKEEKEKEEKDKEKKGGKKKVGFLGIFGKKGGSSSESESEAEGGETERGEERKKSLPPAAAASKYEVSITSNLTSNDPEVEVVPEHARAWHEFQRQAQMAKTASARNFDPQAGLQLAIAEPGYGPQGSLGQAQLNVIGEEEEHVEGGAMMGAMGFGGGSGAFGGGGRAQPMANPSFKFGAQPAAPRPVVGAASFRFGADALPPVQNDMMMGGAAGVAMTDNRSFEDDDEDPDLEDLDRTMAVNRPPPAAPAPQPSRQSLGGRGGMGMGADQGGMAGPSFRMGVPTMSMGGMGGMNVGLPLLPMGSMGGMPVMMMPQDPSGGSFIPEENYGLDIAPAPAPVPVPAPAAPRRAAASRPAGGEDEVPEIVKQASVAKVHGWFNQIPDDTADPIPTPLGSDADDSEPDEEGNFEDYASLASGVSRVVIQQQQLQMQQQQQHLPSLNAFRPAPKQASPAPQAPPPAAGVRNFNVPALNMDD